MGDAVGEPVGDDVGAGVGVPPLPDVFSKTSTSMILGVPLLLPLLPRLPCKVTRTKFAEPCRPERAS